MHVQLIFYSFLASIHTLHSCGHCNTRTRTCTYPHLAELHFVPTVFLCCRISIWNWPLRPGSSQMVSSTPSPQATGETRRRLTRQELEYHRSTSRLCVYVHCMCLQHKNLCIDYIHSDCGNPQWLYFVHSVLSDSLSPSAPCRY